jgi:hypothetical protein
MTEPGPAQNPVAAPEVAPARVERGWGRLVLAILAFLFVPMMPHLRALLPIDQTMLLFVPAVAACALVGWWAGGRPFVAIAWVGLAALVTMQTDPAQGAFFNLARGWSLLVAGAFGLVCLFTVRRPMFSRALAAVAVALAIAAVMSLLGPVTMSKAASTVAAEFDRRNAETVATVNGFIDQHKQEWQEITTKVPQLASAPQETEQQLKLFASAGSIVFPALLALESLAALALAWATYHRLGRARLGAPLGKLREFRFNDQLVWGLIVGLTIVLLPTLASVQGVGKNLLMFFGALYAVRGVGVLTWFLAPGTLTIALVVGFVLLGVPLLNLISVLVFMMLGVTALALGLGDTWADWRNRARPPAKTN